jgi:serine/threonine-protein kinase
VTGVTTPPVQIRDAFAAQYPIERSLGRGGMATVYLARDLKHQRLVALKVLHPELTAGLGSERFLREIRIEANLQHPHILPLHDSGEAGGFLYYVMPYVDGESLRQRLGREGPLPLPDCLRIIGDVGEALAYAHDRGVIHRDVKPENILLSGGHAMVADFGIAKAVEAAGDASLTETGWGLGTPAYMSPEQIAGGTVDGRSDIYGLGCVLYELLAGYPPFVGPNARAIFNRHHLDPVTPVSAARPEVPPHIDHAVLQALAKEPDDRFITVAQFLDALQVAHASQPIPLGVPGPIRGPATPHRSPSGAQPGWSAGDRPVSTKPRTSLVVLAIAGVLAIGGYLVAFGRGRIGAGGLRAASVAVVPIEDLGGDSNHAHVAEALTNELITDLTRIQALRVINRQTMQKLATDHPGGVTPKAVASMLKVDAVVTTTLQWLGDTVHLTAQVTLAGEDGTLWAESYDAPRGDLLRVQRDIARAVVGQLRGRLTPLERSELSAARPVDPEALDLYERGRRLWNRRGRQALGQAIQLFDQALDHDPRFAQAYSAEADAYVQLGYGGYLAPGDAFPKARAAAEKALALDSSLAEPHAALAYVHFYYDWDWPGAEQEFRLAIHLNPSYATAHEWYGLYLSAMGRFDSAVAEERRAMSLEPLSAPIMGTAGWVLYYAGRQEEAARQLRIALRTDSSFGLGKLYLGRVEQAQGKLDTAMAYYDSLGSATAWVPSIAGLGNIYGLMHRRTDALRQLSVLDSLEQAGVYVTPYGRALVYAGLGDFDRSIGELDRAVSGKSHWVVWLNRDTRWQAMRTDPRFRALTARIRLPA